VLRRVRDIPALAHRQADMLRRLGLLRPGVPSCTPLFGAAGEDEV